MEPKLLILVTYHAKPGRGRAFLSEITAQHFREKILEESGCERYDYYLSSSSEDEALLIEQWQSAAHQKAHMEQAHMQQLLALKNREILSTEIQKILL